MTHLLGLCIRDLGLATPVLKVVTDISESAIIRAREVVLNTIR